MESLSDAESNTGTEEESDGMTECSHQSRQAKRAKHANSERARKSSLSNHSPKNNQRVELVQKDTSANVNDNLGTNSNNDRSIHLPAPAYVRDPSIHTLRRTHRIGNFTSIGWDIYPHVYPLFHRSFYLPPTNDAATLSEVGSSGSEYSTDEMDCDSIFSQNKQKEESDCGTSIAESDASSNEGYYHEARFWIR